MNSRERISAAFMHVRPDKVPIDFGGHRSSGIAAQAYIKLRKFLGLPPSKLYVYDFIQQLSIIEDDVLDIFGADVVEVAPPFDQSGNTALAAATMMYELLCILAEARVANE